MRLSRAAFAVVIKFSEYFEDFVTMIDDMDFKAEELKDKEVKEA